MIQGKRIPQGFVLKMGDKAPFLDLRFRIRNTPIAKRWARLLIHSMENGGIYEGDRFINFNPNPNAEIQKAINSLMEVIDRLKEIHREINFGKIDFSDIQSEVNRLHILFADRHLIFKNINETNLVLWEKVNLELHHLESLLKRKKIEDDTGIRNAFINLTFQSLIKEELNREDFHDGVLGRQFGVCYLAYSQVGRHIAELYFSNDRDVPIDHIRPFKFMSANVKIWFGYNKGSAAAVQFEKKLESWFSGDWKKIFEKAHLKWDLLELGIPEIPVAYLEEPIYSTREMVELQNKIFEAGCVRQVELY